MSSPAPTPSMLPAQAAWVDALAAPVLVVVGERLRYANAAAV